MSSSCPLSSTISDEKSATNFIQKSDESFLAGCFQGSQEPCLSVSLACNRLIVICLDVNLLEFILFGVH